MIQAISPQFNSGANQLTNTLHGMIRGMSDKPPVLQFGTINDDFSLEVDGFPCPIPPDEFSVCRSVLYSSAFPLTEDLIGEPKKIPDDSQVAIENGKHTHPCGSPYCNWNPPSGDHIHWVQLPMKMRRLQPGDRVLVAAVANEFVVIDIFYPAKWLTKPDEEPDWSGQNAKSVS